MSDSTADTMDGGGEVRLTFRALPGAGPLASRVRVLLKIALRSLRLRCTSVEQLPPPGPPPGGAAGEPEAPPPPARPVRGRRRF